MRANINAIFVIILGLVISGCGQGKVPEGTLTPIPVSLAYKPVPRWMILDQPFNNVEILGEKWNYTNDRWGDTYACIRYSREKGTLIEFEQCFTLVYNETVSFESQRKLFLGDGFEELTPQNSFNDTGQIALLGKRLSGNANEVIEFFEIVGIGEYVTLIELYIEIDDSSTLQAIYEKQVAEIMDYVLQDSLQKSRLIPRSTATPLSPTQEGFFATLGDKLITELEANTLYEGSWEALGDFIDPNNPMVCRDFEDRTNADVLWVSFSNCINLHYPEFNFEDFANSYKEKPENVFLESSHHYNDKFFLYGQFKGHTYFDAWMLHGEYLYYVTLESRTIGEATVENIFTKEVDDFIYAVLMLNAEK
jgi:hypothetical protein